MTTDTTDTPRTNPAGHPCPAWCASHHKEGVIGHYGDYVMGMLGSVGVKADHYPGDSAEVRLNGPDGQVLLNPALAGDVAGILEALPEGASAADLAARLRAAVAILEDAQ